MEVSADGSLEWPPVPPKRLRVLSAADWAHWNDHGFVKIPAAVPLANAGTAVLLHRPCTSAGFSVVTAERAHQQINITGVGQVPLAQLDAVVSNTATAATAAVLLHRPSVLFSRWGLSAWGKGRPWGEFAVPQCERCSPHCGSRQTGVGSRQKNGVAVAVKNVGRGHPRLPRVDARRP